jgi:hypothetical protein
MKIKVVYDKFTKRLLPCTWNKDGTVTIFYDNYNTNNEIDPIVSMVDSKYVDFDTGIVHIKED